ncbi:PE-PPE domain-containing protein [Mycobacterium sp. NPDC048908]|uniref:PE-PPE domain-containing protein n=1 Tax=Mycobacterium sp. NPDC048908 TaxID=3364292 RepID=UPI003717C8C9
MSKTASKRVNRVAIGFAAVGVATTVATVAATQPASISTPLIDLSALIVVGSSTHPDGSGSENFFNGLFNAPPYNPGDDLLHVNFFSGPFGINQALQAHSGEDNAVLSSGWGAANASLLLMALQATKDPVLAKTVFILDNNVARPDGGFGTRYPWFALIGVNPIPSPTDTDALGVVDVGYEYDYNSNAPADVLNPVAAVNSLAAYLYRHLNQNDLDLPVNPDGSPSVTCGGANTCGVTDNGDVLACPDARCEAIPEGDRVAAYVTQRGNTTYVTYTSNGLPLTNLIRDVVPFGNVIADLTEPVLTAIVNSAYPHGNPIPADPSKYQPATPFSSLPQLASTALNQTASTSDSELKSATDEPAVKKKRPKRNVVRDSEKAVPGSTTDDDASPEANPTVAVGKPTKSEPADSDASGDSENRPKHDKDKKPDKS